MLVEPIHHKNKTYTYLFKFMLLGDLKAGKSSLWSQYSNQQIKKQYQKKQKECAEYAAKIIQVKNERVKLEIWDMYPGFLQHLKVYKQNPIQHHTFNAIGIIFVFDISKRQSFQNAKVWLQNIKQLKQKRNPHTRVAVVGNKFTGTSRAISQNQGKQLAEQFKGTYYEVGSQDYQNVKLIFQGMAQKIIEAMQNGQIQSNYKFYGVRKEEADQNIILERTKIERKANCC